MAKTTVTIPAEMIPEFEAWGKATAKLFGKLRKHADLKPKRVPRDQTWFWTEEWQAGEREVDDELARGGYVDFENAEEAIKHLHEQV